MKQLIVFVLISWVAAAPRTLSRTARAPINDVQLLRYESDNDGLGTYSFAYDQSDGSARSETGELRNAGTDNEFIAVEGSYSWIGPDGQIYTVEYIADEKGFHPKMVGGAPTGAIPAHIAALLLN